MTRVSFTTFAVTLPTAFAKLLPTAFAFVVLLALPATAQDDKRRDLITQCMACHGDDGIAKDKDVPHLAGQNYEYLLNQMRHFQNGKRPHKEMKVMSRKMDESEMAEIADFYASLPRQPR